MMLGIDALCLSTWTFGDVAELLASPSVLGLQVALWDGPRTP